MVVWLVVSLENTAPIVLVENCTARIRDGIVAAQTSLKTVSPTKAGLLKSM